MCGIAGLWHPAPGTHGDTHSALQEALCAMTDALVHRGPDDEGQWVDAQSQIGLGMRRLAIIDLSTAGHQPMASADGRFVMVFNGEIYNYPALRTALNPNRTSPWRGHSDTEALLEAIVQWGVDVALINCVGMFAFALWDRQTHTLTLARDRFGEKPLYYGTAKQGALLFGSELKALSAHPLFEGHVNREALGLYLRYGYVPAPLSIYQDIYKLMPGTSARFALTSAGARQSASAGGAGCERLGLFQIQHCTYWSAQDRMREGLEHPFEGDDKQATDELERLLSQAVQGQMLADVPLGAFLSGGVDSSTIVALMQAASSRPVKTFTIGFTQTDFNEAEHARAVAAQLGTEHTELYVSTDDARQIVPRLPHLYDEPFSDSSQIPTFLLAQLTRRHVTVSLSGDAGDELFCGYTRYDWGRSLWGRAQRYPRSLVQAGATLAQRVPAHAWDALIRCAKPVLPKHFQKDVYGDHIHKIARLMTAPSPDVFYDTLIAHWHPSPLGAIPSAADGPLEAGCVTPSTGPNLPPMIAQMKHIEEGMMLADVYGYLPNDILVKVDRAAMGTSLETRVPMLDHRVAEFAWRLPLALKQRGQQTKWVLRQVLYRHVPPGLIERPKQGFAAPIGDWLRHELRDWAEALLDERRLLSEGFLDPKPIRQKWQQHLAGRRDWKHYLWDVLMFQAWLEHAAARA